MTSVASFVVAFATALAGLAAAVASFLVAEGSAALKKRKDCHCCLPPSQAAFLAHSAGGFSKHCDWLKNQNILAFFDQKKSYCFNFDLKSHLLQ